MKEKFAFTYETHQVVEKTSLVGVGALGPISGTAFEGSGIWVPLQTQPGLPGFDAIICKSNMGK